ncbi:Hypp3359 [Branchiostoma lanceolatum]|uniref:Hypp3359 protein n=1 Tax=Branchiostoma lanceolatum TaxID=7740 RepID=A0A8K0A2L8_BRALA|nr:Hypp3359 [Branchiostoma lanceolatum]
MGSCKGPERVVRGHDDSDQHKAALKKDLTRLEAAVNGWIVARGFTPKGSIDQDLGNLKKTPGTNFRGLDKFLKENKTVADIHYSDVEMDKFMKSSRGSKSVQSEYSMLSILLETTNKNLTTTKVRHTVQKVHGDTMPNLAAAMAVLTVLTEGMYTLLAC